MIKFSNWCDPMTHSVFGCVDEVDEPTVFKDRGFTSIDGLSSGTWSAEKGRFFWSYGGCDEVIFILEGNASIRDCDDPLGAWNHVGPGSSVHFTAGSRAEWIVPEYVRKVWVTRDARLGLMYRVVRKLKKIARATNDPGPAMFDPLSED
jgi:uncharacterized cupin superfamily protein